MQVVYNGAHPEVVVDEFDANQVIVRGEAVEIPDALATRLIEQDTWTPVETPAEKRAREQRAADEAAAVAAAQAAAEAQAKADADAAAADAASTDTKGNN